MRMSIVALFALCVVAGRPVSGAAQAPLADALNLPPKAEGLMVKSVAKGSPAEVSGLRAGTLPATIDGRDIILGSAQETTMRVP